MNHSKCQTLRLDADARKNTHRRMLTIKGHAEGILRMLQDEQVYCVDVLKQIKAVNGALEKVGAVILRSHLKDHVVTAHKRGDTDKIVEELMEVLKYR